MKIKDYCNKLIKVTMGDKTVKYYHFTKLSEYKVFMDIMTVMDDIRFIDVYDHVHTELVAYRRWKEKDSLQPRKYIPVKTTVSVKKGVSYGKIRNTTCNPTETGRSSKE